MQWFWIPGFLALHLSSSMNSQKKVVDRLIMMKGRPKNNNNKSLK